MNTRTTVDDRNFRASIRELSKVSGRTYLDTFKMAGAAPIIKILARDKAAKPPAVKKIRAAVEKRAALGYKAPGGRVSVNVKFNNGRTWWRANGSSKWRLVYAAGPSKGWRLSATDWQQFLSAVQHRQKWIISETKRRAAHRGALRMSFIQIADQLRINLAQAAGGKLSENIPRRAIMPARLGQGRATASGDKFSLIFANYSSGVRTRAHTTFRKNTGQYWTQRLQSAINRRAKAIETDMRKGVFEDIKLRSQRYPGLFVKN